MKTLKNLLLQYLAVAFILSNAAIAEQVDPQVALIHSVIGNLSSDWKNLENNESSGTCDLNQSDALASVLKELIQEDEKPEPRLAKRLQVAEGYQHGQSPAKIAIAVDTCDPMMAGWIKKAHSDEEAKTKFLAKGGEVRVIAGLPAIGVPNDIGLSLLVIVSERALVQFILADSTDPKLLKQAVDSVNWNKLEEIIKKEEK